MRHLVRSSASLRHRNHWARLAYLCSLMVCVGQIACAQKSAPAHSPLAPVRPSSAPVRSSSADALASNFAAPPDATKPRTYWYWIDGKFSKEGITRDLETMRKVGVGEAYIGVIGGEAGDTGPGGVPALTEEWWQHIEHAVREGGRLGVDIGVFNGPAWSQSGGPWVKQSESMRHLVSSEIRLKGPQHFEGSLPAPEGAIPSQDVVTIAFPAPTSDADSISTRAPKISGDAETRKLFDGELSTSAPVPRENDKHAITLEVEQPFTARSLVFFPVREIVSSGELQVSDDGINYRKVSSYTIDRHYLSPALGAEPLAPISLSFPATTGRSFRLTFSNADPLKEIVLSGAARIESYAEKHLGKLFQGPQPPPDFYRWPHQNEPDATSLAVPPAAVRDISNRRNDNQLSWDVPEGEWVVQRFAMASTYAHNSPAPAGARGFEVDKLNRVPLRNHFNAYVGKLLQRMPAADRKALKHVVVDSYEVGSQNWTEGFGELFKTRYGYDPKPYLPTLSGRMVGSADQSNRFLWDFRRLVGDRVASEYVGGLSSLSREHGLKLWAENYGGGGFFGEYLQYGGQSDEIGGEFWVSGDGGKFELRDAASAAHIYGKPVVFAESWTGGPNFISTPWSLKKRGDWAFCQGLNQIVFHVNIGQSDERRPGISAWFGTEFNRHNTWFPESKSWVDYLRRCHYMLQQGKYVADVAYFIGEDTPQNTGPQLQLPAGYSFDWINADVILNRLSVKNGRFVLPDGMSYRVLALAPGTSMRPATLAKIKQLVEAGGTVLLNSPPTRSPSLQNYPQCDAQIQTLAKALWGRCDGTKVKTATVGNGRVFRNESFQGVFNSLKLPADLTLSEEVLPEEVPFIHRRSSDADIYFLSNQSDRTIKFVTTFRVGNKAPELFDPVTGKHISPALYNCVAGRTSVPLTLSPRGSTFVVFRRAVSPSRIVAVEQGAKTLASAIPVSPVQIADRHETPNFDSFTVSTWVKPETQTSLPSETKSGFSELYTKRNDFAFPQQGGEFNLGAGYAGSGLAVGTNGVVVYEHSDRYFAPVLAYPTLLKHWTHVAVVYDKSQTRLYLDGKLVHVGQKTDYKVRPSQPGDAFIGASSGYRLHWRPLSPAEVQKIMRATSPLSTAVDALGGPLQLTQDEHGDVNGLAWESGRFEMRNSQGKSSAFNVAPMMKPMDISNAWMVQFPAESGAPRALPMEKLASLTKEADPTIKYFSGTATYIKNLDIPANALGRGKHLFLDLGAVASLAQVTLNGQNLGTLWSSPFVLDISKAARIGSNELKIRVTNAWHNRLVGQTLNRDAFLRPRVEQVWTSHMPQYGPDEALLEAGLIGPVVLRQATEITLH